MQIQRTVIAEWDIIDGIERPISTDSLNVMADVDMRLTKPLQFRMDVSADIVGSEYYATVTIQVLNGAGIDFSNTVLQTVLTQTDTKFYDVMRVMLPSNAGQSLSGISQTEEVVFQTQTTLNPSWVVDNLHTVAFIQNVTSKEIYQSSSNFD